jgi:threonine/homoserine/homoserine lactone efflux protein
MPVDQLLLFVAAGLLLNLTPGPDVLYLVTHALRSGARSGIVAALGITAGCFVHIVAAALGVSALMAASATAFMVLKWAGALYLVYVGLRMLLSTKQSATFLGAAYASSTKATDIFDIKNVPANAFMTIFSKGFATNALNPKVALFFLAFLPQFIAPGVVNKPLAFFLLGLLFTFNGMWVNIGWAVAAAWVARKAQSVQTSMLWLDRVAGTLFIAFGLKLALTDNPAS